MKSCIAAGSRRYRHRLKDSAVGEPSVDALPAEEHGEDCSRVDEAFSGNALLAMLVIPLALHRITQHLHVADMSSRESVEGRSTPQRSHHRVPSACPNRSER